MEIIETFKKSGLRNLEIIKADIPFAGTTKKDSTTSLRKSRIKDKKKDGIRREMISKKKVIKK